MIDYIKYSIDGKPYSLTNNGDGTWRREDNAPSVTGNYLLTFTICENGIVTTVDSSNSLYETYLQVIADIERIAYLETYVPSFITKMREFTEIYYTENEEFDNAYTAIERLKSDVFITTATNDAIARREKFIEINASGTLNQRKSYLITINQKRNKLSETVIKSMAKTIAGAECIVKFFGSDEIGNPIQGNGTLRVQVLSPDTTKDYKYDDIERAIKPLVPSHIKLIVIKYFALWSDIVSNFSNWGSVKTMNDWQAVKDYIPPQ